MPDSSRFQSGLLRWESGRAGHGIRTNAQISEVLDQIHEESPDKGRIRDDLERYHDMHVNDKRVLRICRAKSISRRLSMQNRGSTRHIPPVCRRQYIEQAISCRQAK